MTRESGAIFGLGAGITEKNEEIAGCTLLTNEQVIRCCMFLKQEGSAQSTASNRTKRDYAKIVLEKIFQFVSKKISSRLQREKL